MVIDRFEGDFAICELPDGKFEKISRKILPDNACEGDVIIISVDKDESCKRKEYIKNKMNKLFKD